VLVPVGAYALWIYGGRLDEMRKATQAALESIKLTRESAHLDQRAWVGTIAVEGQPKVREVMRFQVTIKNSGKTFARKMRVSSCGYTRESALGPPPFEIDETGAPYLQPDASSVLMMPEQTTTTEYVLNNAAVVSDTFLDDLKNGAKVVWLHGRIMYEDIFGCPHWTKFCYKMDRAFGFGVCKEDNEDDDNLCR